MGNVVTWFRPIGRAELELVRATAFGQFPRARERRVMISRPGVLR